MARQRPARVPLDNDVPAQPTPAETGLKIFRANVDLMRKCDFMVANMTPFRGPSMDVGTAFEMGFMMAQGKPVLAYTKDRRGFTDRTKEFVRSRGGRVESKRGTLRDSHGLALENFGFIDNLMLDGVVGDGGARIESGFEAVLKANAERLHRYFSKR